MDYQSYSDIEKSCAGFRIAWRSLLANGHITEANIETLPCKLMMALLSATLSGERDPQRLAQAALERLEFYGHANDGAAAALQPEMGANGRSLLKT